MSRKTAKMQPSSMKRFLRNTGLLVGGVKVAMQLTVNEGHKSGLRCCTCIASFGLIRIRMYLYVAMSQNITIEKRYAFL